VNILLFFGISPNELTKFCMSAFAKATADKVAKEGKLYYTGTKGKFNG
jgi:hypothetical protein